MVQSGSSGFSVFADGDGHFLSEGESGFLGFTTLGVMGTGQSQSVAYMKSEYEPKFGVVGALLDRVFLRWVMGLMFSRVLKGLEAYSAKQ